VKDSVKKTLQSFLRKVMF